MILHYLWKRKSRGPDDFEFSPEDEKSYNFGSKYIFNYDCGRNTMKAEAREDLPEDFFCPTETEPVSKIANVTCIVGANGSGKTTLLQWIAESFFYDRDFGVFGEYVFVIETLESNEFGAPGFYVGSSNNSMPMMQKPDWLISSNPFVQFYIKQEFAKWSLVFYSNIFDFGYFPDGPDIKNISTNYLLRKAPEFALNEGNANMPESQAFKLLEMRQNVAFISAPNKPKLPFELPKNLEVGVYDANIRKIAQSCEKEGVVHEIILQCTKEFNEDFNTNLQERYLIWLHLAALCSYLKDHSLKDGIPDVNTEIEQSWSNLSGKGKALKYLELLEPSVPFAEKGNPRDILNFLNLIVPVIIDRIATNRGVFMGGSLNLSIPEDMGILQSIFTLYYQAISITDFLYFDWPGLSSGEQSMLTMFARFYSLKVPRASNIHIGKYILVLIDEGTEYFHPEWQRNFLKYLLDFLPFVYGSDKVIQIIIATNSPFVLSDIPRGNVIVLGKHEEQEEIGMTFGANIHSLLAHGMFMKNTIGGFAEEKIQQVIDILLKEKASRSELEWCLTVSKLIGDRLIGNELQRTISRKMSGVVNL